MYLKGRWDNKVHSGIELTAHVYNAILSHLVGIEEGRDEIVNEFYDDSSEMRENFMHFLDNYTDKLDELVRSVQIVDKPSREKLKLLNFLPYVIIGSIVELEDLNNNSTKVYRIISPYESRGSKDELSYVSALGRELMLKKPGDIIRAQIDSEVYLYCVKVIRYECW